MGKSCDHPNAELLDDTKIENDKGMLMAGTIYCPDCKRTIPGIGFDSNKDFLGRQGMR